MMRETKQKLRFVGKAFYISVLGLCQEIRENWSKVYPKDFFRTFKLKALVLLKFSEALLLQVDSYEVYTVSFKLSLLSISHRVKVSM